MGSTVSQSPSFRHGAQCPLASSQKGLDGERQSSFPFSGSHRGSHVPWTGLHATVPTVVSFRQVTESPVHSTH
jgi:hypothetical protein